MPTIPARAESKPRPTLDPQLREFAEEVLATFRAAAEKAIVSQTDPSRATLTDDRGSVEHTLLGLFRQAPEDARARASERILATLDGSDRPQLNLGSARSVESQVVLRANFRELGEALRIPSTGVPQRPVVVVPSGDPVTREATKAIDAKRASATFLGAPQSRVAATPDGSGRFRHYEHGSIYWTAKTGAHEVHGAIRDKWKDLGWERGVLGYPTTDETKAPDGRGRFNHFEGGSIYWSPDTGAHEVHGAIRQKWADLGFEKGYLGYPTTDETIAPDTVGRFSHFQGGSIYWTPTRGAFALHHEVRDVWGNHGFELGDLGYPIEDTQLTTPKRQRFEGGAIEDRQVKRPKTKVQLRLHAVGLVDETTGAEIGDDEIHMGGAVVDASGATNPIQRFHVMDFNEGEGGREHKLYDPPKVLHAFALSDSRGWPKTYVSTLLLAEVDSGGFEDMLRELLKKLREYVGEQLKKAAAAIGAAIGAAVGAAAGLIGAAIGAVVGFVLGALFDWLDGLFEDVSLSPAVFHATVPDVWAVTNTKDVRQRATGAGGAYNIRGDYALR